MKKRIVFRILSLTFILLCLMACRRHRFRLDNLPSLDNMKANISIMEFKEKLYTQPGRLVEVKDDYIIAGVVVANDEGGNFYKQLVLQDESGGIAVLIDGTNLFNDFPLGRRVFVRTKGLYLNDYAHSISLGALGEKSNGNNEMEDGPKKPLRLTGIPTHLTNTYLERGSFNNSVEPLEVDIDSLNTSLHNRYQNTLIVLKNMEATGNNIKGVTLANPNPGSSRLPFGLHTLKNCNTRTVTLKTSNYALFAKELLPQGNGSVTGIFTPFHRNNKSERQISIRGVEDLDMEGARCSIVPQRKTIAEILKYPKGKPFPEGWYIEGQIISEEKNESCANYALQDETAGIQLYLGNISSSSPRTYSGRRPRTANAYYSNPNAGYTYDDEDLDESMARRRGKNKERAKSSTSAKAPTPCSANGFLKLDTLIRIDLTGLKLGEFNGNMQIEGGANGISKSNFKKAEKAKPVQTKTISSIKEVYQKGKDITFQLIAIPKVKICKSKSPSCKGCTDNSSNNSSNCSFPVIAQSGSGNTNQDTIITFVRGTSGGLLSKVQSYVQCKAGNGTNNNLDTIKGYVKYFGGKPQIVLRAEGDLVNSSSGGQSNSGDGSCACACDEKKKPSTQPATEKNDKASPKAKKPKAEKSQRKSKPRKPRKPRKNKK